MKRVMMQLMRTLVTVIVVGTMAVMIVSLRSELAEAKRMRPVELKMDPAAATLGTIARRASCRAFDPDRSVAPADVERLLRAAMSAPTAMDRRPWEFVVITNRQQLAALGQALPYSRIANGAPMAIAVCGILDNGLEGRNKEYWIQDCSAASENLLLAAEAMGLGALWSGVYPGEDRVRIVREILGVPPTHMPLNLIPVGYPQGELKPKDKWNPAKIHFDRW